MPTQSSSAERKTSRYCFFAKQQVWVGDDILTASSHSPRHWMWHGNGQARPTTGRGRVKFSRRG